MSPREIEADKRTHEKTLKNSDGSIHDGKSRNLDKSKKSIGLSISSNMGASREKSHFSSNQDSRNKEEGKDFKPFVVRKEQALSVITHTPTNKEGPCSIALSAITHTPTEKSEVEEKQSINLSALHLSQKEYEEELNKSYRSLALSAVRVYEPKNYQPAPRFKDQSVDQSQNYQTDKSISAMNKSIHEVALGKSDNGGVAELIHDDKSLDPKSYINTEKSIDAKTNNLTEKSIGARTNNLIEKSIGAKSIHNEDKSINPKTVHNANKSIGPKTVFLTEKSIAPITDNKEDKSIHPRSYLLSREGDKYPRHHKNRSKDMHPKKYRDREEEKYPINHKSKLENGIH